MDNKEAAIAARNIITDRSPSAVGMSIPRLQGMIPTALDLWQMKVMDDKESRELLKTTVSVTLSGGVGNLANYVNGTTAQINLQDLRNTTLYTEISGVRTPLTWVSSQQQLNQARQLDQDAPAVFLEGQTLRTRNTDGSLTSLGSAAVEFTAISYPQTVADIPVQLQESFVLTLVELAMKELGQ